MNRCHRASLALAATALVGSAAFAQTEIASTSFEEPPVFDGIQYVDLGDPLLDHPLVNNPGEPFVEYATVGGEMGYTAFYTNTRNDVGLTDGDFVGVTNFTGTVTAYTDGDNGYQFQDADGLMTVTFDEVDLTGFATAAVELDAFIRETGWEIEDRIRIWVVADGSTDIDMLNTEGSDIDDLGIEGSWITYSADLTGFATATLKIELDSNSSSEEMYIDRVVFFGDTGGGDLTLLPPVPGTAGTQNTLETQNATPGERIYYGYGFQGGTTPIPGCATVVDIDNATLAGSAIADGSGVATLTSFVPGGAAGRQVLIQSVELNTCRVSNLVTQTF
ncbi:MAG: hypothetical protein ACF8PN_00950 [Phycisphaerales bacterium]